MLKAGHGGSGDGSYRNRLAKPLCLVLSRTRIRRGNGVIFVRGWFMRYSRPRLLGAVAVLALVVTGSTVGLEIAGRHSPAGHSQRSGNNGGALPQPSTLISGGASSSPGSRGPRASQRATATPSTGPTGRQPGAAAAPTAPGTRASSGSR